MLAAGHQVDVGATARKRSADVCPDGASSDNSHSHRPDHRAPEQYDESIRRLEESGDFPPDGLDYHVRFGADGNLKVSEIWACVDSASAAARSARDVRSAQIG